ncbi:hypothetical protein DNHGIG_02360 [Collibacillus ludicampi]|uniref:Uncharacterized protein n=1 Tax=Collibacillus ludicampi TaxID=2771369 RepID=A0AAV4LA87_9BACL|nr:YiiX/YebB-like N1pC/P60 family cysteine hydrolase [Collibacillus ludicampi]GIM44687.1 hypothetical protein DNHGIG_02360 [Collibacillus ludicampi]
MKMKKLILFFTVCLPTFGTNLTFAASSQVPIDENLNRPHIEKPSIPADPRGPLPKDASEWDQWIKKHPDPLAKNGGVTSSVIPASITLGPLVNGDIILGASPTNGSKSSVPYGYFRHAAMYDSGNGNFISAMPGIGVYRETTSFWSNGYNVVRNMYVTNASYTQRQSVVQNAAAHIGEPYNFGSSKTDISSWYCSKLPWFEYNKWASIDIDANGGYWVTPDDIYNDSDVTLAW